MAGKNQSIMPRMGRLRGAIIVAVASVLIGCASEPPLYVERPVNELYNEAMDQLLSGDEELAADGFDEVERQHPYSIWARKAQLMAAYANYQVNKYDEAILAAERFIELHPSNANTPYAYYLVAICHYEQIVDVGRDQANTERALQALSEVIDRFPDTEYARDAQLKIDLTRDHLAGKEMAVGRYYLNRNAYVAAVNRFRTVVEKYQTTSQVPEALHRLVETYLAMGVAEEAERYAAVLGYNYPGSQWYADSYFLLTGEQVAVAEAERPWYQNFWQRWF